VFFSKKGDKLAENEKEEKKKKKKQTKPKVGGK